MSLDLSEREQTWRELFKFVDEFPNHYPVETWVVGGLQIWPILKTQFMLRACNLFHAEAARILIDDAVRDKADTYFLSNRKNSKPNWSRRAHVFAQKARRPFMGHRPPPVRRQTVFGRAARSWPSEQADVLMFGSSIGGHKCGKHIIQPLLDPIRSALAEARLSSSVLLTDTAAESDTLDSYAFGGVRGIQEQFNSIRSLYKNNYKVNYDKFLGFTELLVGVSTIFDLEKIQTRQIMDDVIGQTVSVYKVLKEYFYINRIRAVFTYAFYGILGHAAAAACRDIGIPLFDVQHGTAGRGHESYHWPGIPPGGYNTLPTNFLCWSSSDANDLNQHFRGWAPVADTVGHSWRLVEEMFEQPDPLILDNKKFRVISNDFKKSKTEAAKLIKKLDGDFYILVTLYSDQDTSFVRDVIKQAPNQWKFLIRLHPGEALREEAIERRRKEFKGLQVDFDVANGFSMPALAPLVDAHLTKYSSSVLDLAAYSVPSVCFSWSGNWFYSDLKNAGQVDVVEMKAEAVVSSLQKALDSGPTAGERSLSIEGLSGLLRARISETRPSWSK